jgi:hypothetical protein
MSASLDAPKVLRMIQCEDFSIVRVPPKRRLIEAIPERNLFRTGAFRATAIMKREIRGHSAQRADCKLDSEKHD